MGRIGPAGMEGHPAVEDRRRPVVGVVVEDGSGNPRVGKTLTEAQYLDLPHLAFSMPSEGSGSAADVHLSHLGVQRRIAAWTESFILSPFLVRGTEMVTLMHERVARALQDAAEARIITPPYELPELKEVLLWNPRRTADPPHLWMREQIQAAAQEIG